MEPFFLMANVNGTWDVILFLFEMFMVYVGVPVLLLAGGVQVILLVGGGACDAAKSLCCGPSAEKLPGDEILMEPMPAAVAPRRVAIPVAAIPVQVRVAPLATRGSFGSNRTGCHG